VIWKVQLSGVLAVILFGIAPVFSQPVSEGIEVRHWLSQTAIFPGDRIIYSLEIRCATNVDILIKDLDIARLNLTGLEAVSSGLERDDSGNGVTYRVNYELTAYTPASPELLIGEQSVRYYVQRPGERADSASPEREIIVPATEVVLRSTLAADPATLHIRDDLPVTVASADTGWIRYVGLGLVLFSGLPVAIWGVPLLRGQLVSMREKRAAAEPHALLPEAMDDLRNINAGSGAARRDGYELLEKLLRGHLAQTAGVLAYSLTATEAAERLPHQIAGVSRDELVTVLADCQLARYGRADNLPTVDRFESGINVIQGLYNTR